jgi:hypothetical protein
MRAFHAKLNAIKRDEIAARHIRLGKPYSGKLRLQAAASWQRCHGCQLCRNKPDILAQLRLSIIDLDLEHRETSL